MRSLSKPTIQLPPILITGTPVCPVLRTISRAASGSRSMLTSLNGSRCSLKYLFALRHQEHVDVLKRTTLANGRPPSPSLGRRMIIDFYGVTIEVEPTTEEHTLRRGGSTPPMIAERFSSYRSGDPPDLARMQDSTGG